MTSDLLNNLREVAKEMDDRFQAELVRVYGKRAGDKRYAKTHTDLGVIRAKRQKLMADRDLRNVEKGI